MLTAQAGVCLRSPEERLGPAATSSVSSCSEAAGGGGAGFAGSGLAGAGFAAAALAVVGLGAAAFGVGASAALAGVAGLAVVTGGFAGGGAGFADTGGFEAAGGFAAAGGAAFLPAAESGWIWLDIAVPEGCVRKTTHISKHTASAGGGKFRKARKSACPAASLAAVVDDE
jgi:hypothetical protein